MLVSVIIPCYNVQEYISECLESVLSQKYSDIEIICVDNNSNDSTCFILEEYAFKYPERIKVLKELKKGASCARNSGLKIARGEWIQFLDADDLLMPEKIAHQMDLLQSRSEIGFISGSCLKQKVSKVIEKKIVEESDPFKALFVTKLGNTCANLFNAKGVTEIGGWNESLSSSQETDLMFRLLQKDPRVLYDPSPFTIIRERVFGQISQVDPGKNWKQYIEIRFIILDFLKKERKAYFDLEKDFYYQRLFLQLKRLSKYDFPRAVFLFDNFFERNFSPDTKSMFALLYKMFGFKKALGISRFISRFHL